ncbi:hypothetical protein P7D06_29705, partial [Bacillus mobilis]|uniref:hypothetical protein n=1 Tax=Bacillus mobilis TaxID=2026190 RepID=UPI00240E5F16
NYNKANSILQLPVFVFLNLKAKAARLESQDIGTLDLEALFASQEEVKPPTILAAGAGLNKKRKQLVQNRRALELSAILA